jgi:hypothetical protein
MSGMYSIQKYRRTDRHQLVINNKYHMCLPSASLPQFSLTLPSKPLTSLSSDCKASHPGFSRILPVSSECRVG